MDNNIKFEKKQIIYFSLYILIFLIGVVKAILASNYECIAGHAIPMIFFVIGFMSCTEKKGKGVGLIFLYAHGLLGFFGMMTNLLRELWFSPIMTDLYTGHKIYLGLLIVASIIAFAASTVYNLNNKIKEKSKYPIIPLALFLLCFILALICPYVLGII